MKKLLTICMLVLAVSVLTAEDAESILRQADAIFTFTNMYQKSSMVIYSGSQAQPEQVMESYYLKEDGKSHSLMVFLQPSRVRGTAYLTIGDDLWVRFASTGRTRKLSSSARQNSASGSDFSYDDMGEGSDGYAADYQAASVEHAVIKGEACYRITLTPNDPAGSAYDKAVCFITEDTYHYVRIELYSSGAHIKTMTLEDYRQVSGSYYPFTISMASEIRDSKTVITTTEFEYDSPKVQKRLFSKSYLESLR